MMEHAPGGVGDDDISAPSADVSPPSVPVLTLRGLLGGSDHEGRRRLYLSRQLDYYAEFDVADVLRHETVPGEAPVAGLEVFRITLRRDAPVEFTRIEPIRRRDEFDLDIRLSSVGQSPPRPPTTRVDCPDTELTSPASRSTDLCDTGHPPSGGGARTCDTGGGEATCAGRDQPGSAGTVRPV